MMRKEIAATSMCIGLIVATSATAHEPMQAECAALRVAVDRVAAAEKDKKVADLWQIFIGQEHENNMLRGIIHQKDKQIEMLQTQLAAKK